MTDYLETTVDKFTFRVATDRFYTEEGVWILPAPTEGRTSVLVGITDFLQQVSGDVAFVKVAAPGKVLIKGQDLAELETIKVNVAVASPICATVHVVNEALASTPEIVNQDPYGGGWLAVLEPARWETDRQRLLDPHAYNDFMLAEVKREIEKL